MSILGDNPSAAGESAAVELQDSVSRASHHPFALIDAGKFMQLLISRLLSAVLRQAISEHSEGDSRRTSVRDDAQPVYNSALPLEATPVRAEFTVYNLKPNAL